METNNNSDNNFQEINITSIWHKNLFDSLEKLQDFERVCRDGCISITEYLQLPQTRVPEMQFQHLRMMITEMNILINNAKVKLSPAFLLASEIKMNDMKSIVDGSPHEIFIPSFNQQLNQTTYTVSNMYWTILHDLTDIRSHIVTDLSDVLYGKGEEKSNSMTKSGTLMN